MLLTVIFQLSLYFLLHLLASRLYSGSLGSSVLGRPSPPQHKQTTPDLMVSNQSPVSHLDLQEPYADPNGALMNRSQNRPLFTEEEYRVLI